MVSDSSNDFEKLLGPDRRRIPVPRGLGAVVSTIGLLVVVGLVVLWPRQQLDIDLTTFGFAEDVVSAEVSSSEMVPCSYAAEFDCRFTQFEITDPGSADMGLVVGLELPDETGQPVFEVGDGVFLFAVEGDGFTDYQYAGRDRRILLGVVGAIFAVAVIVLGRWRGVAALFALGLSVVILVAFILPAILSGTDAVLVALVGGGAIALISLYLAHGYTPMTHVATLGVFTALVLTTGLSWLVLKLARFSGLVDEESFYLLSVPDLDLNGLLLAGIVLGAIGALDDVTVTQASAVWEVKKADPSIGAKDLYGAGIRVGRDHIVSTVNTLLLAYAGASLPLLILFTLAAQPFGVVASSEVIAVEIVRTLVGSIGLVAAVPATTWLGSRVAAQLEFTRT